MLVVLSPSKTLDLETSVTTGKYTVPEHLESASELMGLLRRCSKKRLRDLILKKPDGIRAFGDDGYKFSAAMSSETELVFLRG